MKTPSNAGAGRQVTSARVMAPPRVEDLGFGKEFLNIGEEASDDDGDDESKKQKKLLKQYEKVDFGKLAEIEFSTSSIKIDIQPSSLQLNKPTKPAKTADFLFDSQELSKATPNEYKPVLTQSLAPTSPTVTQPEVPPTQSPNIWTSGVITQSQTSIAGNFPKSKIAKKDVVESEGFLEF